MASRRSEPTTTHFAILGMLAIRPLSTYELATHFDRSLRRMWPRARSKLFEAPKQLVEMGLARASHHRTGRRPRTVYAITAKGRRALQGWLAIPGEGPEIEYEQLVKVFFAEHGSKAAVLANIDAAEAWAKGRMEHNLEVLREYEGERGRFQERAAQLVLVGTFHTRFALFIDDWARWARPIVEKWPNDPRQAKPELDLLAELGRELDQRLNARAAGEDDDRAGSRAPGRPGRRGAEGGSSSRRRAAPRGAATARRSG
jgi:PadR family transcriptional regulator AphA